MYWTSSKFYSFLLQENGVLIESVDACFGLARKKDRGQYSLISPRHGDLLFSDQNDVDNFVNNYEYGTSGSGSEVSNL